MSEERYPAPYVVTTVIAKPVYLCKRHGEMFLERAEKGGIEASMTQSLDIDKQCQSCINEAKRKNESDTS